MVQLTFEALLAKFAGVASGHKPDEELQRKVCDLFNRVNTTGLILFENQAMDSSQLGRMTVLGIGQGFTYQDIEQVHGKWLNDLPSQRQYPVAYCVKGSDAVVIREYLGK